MAKLIIANWKMNPRTEAESLKLAKVSDFPNVVVAPPFVFLDAAKNILRRADLGAQNVAAEKEGAETGEIAVSQLKALGVRYVIIGHSERRALGETDRLINRKIKIALENDLKAILCVGEPLTVRKRGLRAAQNFVGKQLLSDLRGVRKSNNLLIAYEPIWAIGTGKSDNPAETVAMTIFIKKNLYSKFKINTKLLYGGSVNAKNALAFLREGEINGALVGGASLKPAEFKKIVKIASQY